MQYYFDDPCACQRKLRLYFDHSTLVGYCLLTFTQHNKSTVIRASLQLFTHNIETVAIPSPFPCITVFATGLHVLVRCVLCRYNAQSSNVPGHRQACSNYLATPRLQQSQRALFEHFNAEGRVSPGGSLRCLKPVNRASNCSISEFAAFHASDKKEIAFYQNES